MCAEDRGEWAQLEEWAAGIEEAVDAVAHQQLASVGVLGAGGLTPTKAHQGAPIAQVVDELTHGRGGRRRFLGSHP